VFDCLIISDSRPVEAVGEDEVTKSPRGDAPDPAARFREPQISIGTCRDAPWGRR